MEEKSEFQDSGRFEWTDDSEGTTELEDIVSDRVKDSAFEDLQVSRAEWDALPPAGETVMREGPAKYVVTGFTETNTCWNGITCFLGVQRLQKYYINTLKTLDLPYNFLIGGTGLIFECRGWNQRPKLPDKYSYIEPDSLFIGYFGKYGDIDCITGEMETSMINLIRLGMEQSNITKKILYYQCVK